MFCPGVTKAVGWAFNVWNQSTGLPEVCGNCMGDFGLIKEEEEGEEDITKNLCMNLY